MRKVCFLLILLIMPVFAYGEKLFSPYGQYGLQQFEQNVKMGICDNNGNTIVDAEYEYISPDFHNGCAMLIKDHLIGFYNEVGSIISEPIWEKAWDYQCGLAAIMIENRIGFIDTLGNIIVQPIWSEKSSKYFYCNRALVYDLEGNPYLIDNNGNIVFRFMDFINDQHFDIPDDLAITTCVNGCYILRIWQKTYGENYHYYVLNTDFTLIGPFISKADIAYISDDILILIDEESSSENTVKYINPDGRQWSRIIGTIDDMTSFAEGRGFVKAEEHKWVCFDKTGNTLFELEHDWIPIGYQDGIVTAYDYESDNAYYYDINGELLFTIPGGELASGERVCYYDIDKCAYGYYDYNMNLVIAPEWQSANDFEDEYTVVYDKEYNAYWIDREGHVIAPYKTTILSPASCGTNNKT